MTHDLIIIGGGPAGAAAAVYASRKRLNTLFITSEFGGQSVVSEQIFNWIGTTSLSGTELAENFKKHVLANADEITVLKMRNWLLKKVLRANSASERRALYARVEWMLKRHCVGQEVKVVCAADHELYRLPGEVL